MTGVSTEMNFDDVSVKVEMVDEEYDCNGSLQPNSSAMAEIKTEPLELNESYGVLTEPQVPTNSNPGILLGNPVISSPPIMNRAQLDNYTMNAADVPTKKQIAALVKVAAPSTACTTIKQEVDRACHRLSQEGEQSLFLSVNVEKKLCSYVGSDMGRQFLSKRPDIMEHFFQFCQVLYKTETEAPSNSTAATPPVKKKPKANIRRPNILQQRHSTQNASVPVTAPVKAPAVVIPASHRQPASNYLPVLQPRAIPAVTQAMPEVARILNSSTFTNIKGFVPVALESGQKRKDASQREEQADKPKEMDNHMPFRMNIKKLKAGATKSTLMTLRKSLVSKSASLDTAGNTEGDKSNENSTNNPASQNQKETSKAAPDWDHNLEPPSELFSKMIKLSETGTDVKTVFQTFTAKKFKKGDKKPKMKPIMLRESSAIQAEEKTESSRPYSFRQRTKKKRFGDDYVEDFKEEPKEEEKEEEEEDSGPIKIEIKREIEEEEVDDDNDEDFKVVDSEEEDEDDETDKVDETEKMQENSSCEEVKNDELEWKYFNENSLEQLFNDHRYSAKKNWKGTFQCTICQTSFRWSVSFIQHLVEKHELLLQDLKLHQCIICDKSFLGIRDLATHYRKVHKQLDCFICRNCNSTFNAAVTYDKHVENCRKRAEGTETNEESSQGEEKKFVCNVCLKPLRTAEGLEKHQQIHKKDSYLMCDVCGIRCTTKQRLSCHKYNRHQNKLGNFSCPHCDRRFMSIWTMYRHNQDIHGCTQVICRECGQYFDTQEQLMTHITNDHPYISHDVSRFSCEDCGKWFDQARYLYVHYKEVHRKQRSVCGFCGKGFESREEFHEHKKTHDLTIPNTCKICAKTCNSPEDLEKHMHYHMRGKTLHQCEVCKEVLIRRQDLVEHMVKHTNKLPFICKECGKGFKNKGKLKVHMISHVSHRPFQCDICGMAFKMKATLSTHIKRHKELKPFKCDYCPLRFKSVEGSRNHMLHKHIKMEDLKNIKFKVYKCEYCNKLMGQKHMYMRHVRLHTGERPCICDECGRSFTMPATLNVHKKTHLARKPHHCDICNFGFIDAHKLGKHYQTLRHKQMVEQKKRVKELAETRARNMQKAVESAKVIDSVNIKLEQVDDMDLYGVPERTQIRLGDEMVVVEKASEDGQQGENREPEAANEVYFSSLISDSVQPDPELMTQVLQGTDLENELLIPKTEIMDE
nr:oocyte zinc finger protein XlCOF7.1 isoform X2 [Crassostrea gigas]